MLDALKNPPEPFEDVIRTHFRLKARSVRQQLDEWLSRDDSRETAADGAESASLLANPRLKSVRSGGSFSADISQMKLLLDKLEKREPLA